MTEMPVPNVVGLCGHAQHGKNTIGEVLEDLGYKPVGFADQLRQLAAIVNPYVNGYERYNDILADVGYERAKVLYPEVRRFLQELGTGVRDTVGENAWVQALTSKLYPGEKYVVTDVRFPNEARAIHSLGEVWGVVRPGFDNGLGTDHPSEAHVENILLLRKPVFLNDGTVEDLQAKVRHYIGTRGLA